MAASNDGNAADAPGENEQQYRSLFERSGDVILSAEGDIGALELADIIDVPTIQSLMEEFFRLCHIGIGLFDLQKKVQLATGWQDICMKFHRVNSETVVNCISFP